MIKSDGYPTYNFAHIIDDLLMKCTHVIRSRSSGSVPKYLNLYDALSIERPVLATVPFVQALDVEKLGKRDGAKDILDYARQGFLPEAMINFMATLAGTTVPNRSYFHLRMIDKFSLEHVQRSSARFDERVIMDDAPIFVGYQWMKHTNWPKISGQSRLKVTMMPTDAGI